MKFDQIHLKFSLIALGIGCGTADSAVESYSRGHRFESTHWGLERKIHREWPI